MLKGAPNFRDIGGSVTTDGRRVRSGLVYRSNSLANLTDEDLATIAKFDLRTIVDLRTVAEREGAPQRFASPGTEVLTSAKSDLKTLIGPTLRHTPSDEAGWRRRFSDFFADLPELYAEEYAALFQALAREQTPLLINCSAGKDRTGIAVLLILDVLGVDREVAVADYLLSGERLNGDPAFNARLTGTLLGGLGALPDDARSVMLGVHREHADAAFAAIDRNHGSVETYVTDRLGLSPGELVGIRRRLTEPASQEPADLRLRGHLDQRGRTN